MARITWQNVSAPNTSGSAAALRAASDMVGKAFSGIGDAFRGFGDTRQDQLSKQAMAAALQYRDAADWDKFLAEDGLAGLGVDPSMLSDEAMTFMSNRAGKLFQNHKDEAYVDQTKATTANTLSLMGWRDKNNQWDYDRTVEGYEKGKELESAKLAAQEYATNLADATSNREEATRHILNQDLPANLVPLYLDALKAQPDSRWSTSADAISEVNALPMVRNLDTDLSAFEAEMNITHSADRLGRIYDDANQLFTGYNDPITKVIEDLRSRNELDPEAFKDTAGNIQGSYDTLRSNNKYKNLPNEVIAAVVNNELQQSKDWLVFNGDSQEVSMGKAKKILDELAKPESLKLLQQEHSQRRIQREAISNFKRRSNELKHDLALANVRDSASDKTEAEAAYQGLIEEFNSTLRPPPVPTPTPTPAPNIAPFAPKITSPTASPAPETLTPAQSKKIQKVSSLVEKATEEFQNALQNPNTTDAELNRLYGAQRKALKEATEVQKEVDKETQTKLLYESGQYLNSVSKDNPNRPRPFFAPDFD